MLTILHTADWHLGSKFFGWDRIDEQHYALQKLEQIIGKEQADVLLVAGDVFDSANPSTQAEALYYQFLSSVRNKYPWLQIIISAGNHDSPYRLKAPSPILTSLGVHVVSTIERTPNGSIDFEKLCFPLNDKKGITHAYCVAIPFLRWGNLNHADNPNEEKKVLFAQAVEYAQQKQLPVIVMAHLFVSGATTANIENGSPILMGNDEVTPLDALPQQAKYIALGHIHKAQVLGANPCIRYSGSLIPMSFSEVTYKHSIVKVTLATTGQVNTQLLPLEQEAELIKKRGTEEELNQFIEQLPQIEIDNKAPYLSLVLQSDEPRPDLLEQFRTKLSTRYVKLAQIQIERISPSTTSNTQTNKILRPISDYSPLEVAKLIYAEAHDGESLPKDLEELLQQTIDSLSQ